MDIPAVGLRVRSGLFMLVLGATAVLCLGTCVAALFGSVMVYRAAQVATIRVQNDTNDPLYVDFGAENGEGRVPPHSTRGIRGAWVYRFGLHPDFVSMTVPGTDPTSDKAFTCLWEDAKAVEPVVVTNDRVTCKQVPDDFFIRDLLTATPTSPPPP